MGLNLALKPVTERLQKVLLKTRRKPEHKTPKRRPQLPRGALCGGRPYVGGGRRPLRAAPCAPPSAVLPGRGALSGHSAGRSFPEPPVLPFCPQYKKKVPLIPFNRKEPLLCALPSRPKQAQSRWGGRRSGTPQLQSATGRQITP